MAGGLFTGNYNTMKKILVGGCFDLIHFGHVEFLTNAKSYGDHLVVALESDESVRRMKGPSRPIHTQEQRKRMLESLRFVDEVIMLEPLKSDAEYEALVTGVKPSVIAITEGDPVEEKKRRHASLVHAEVVIIPKVHTPSTSQLAKLLELE